MIRRTWGVTLALTLLLLSGCKSAQPRESQLLIDPLDAQKLGYTSRWLTDLAIPEGLRHIEVLGDLLVGVETPSNMVSAVSARDGQVLWRRVVGDALVVLSPPTRSGTSILINSENSLYTLAADTGALRNLSYLRSPVADAPAISGDIAVFGSVNGRISGHSITAGTERWAYLLPAGILTQPIMVAGNAFLAASDGEYIFIKADDGTLVWRGRTHARISADPVANLQTIFVASEDQSLYALNRSVGRDRWIYRATRPLTRSPILLENSVYLPIPGEALVSIDILSGAELWRIAADDAQPVLVSGSKVLMATRRSLMVLDNQTGKVLTQVPVEQVQTIVRGPENSIILVSTKGRMQRLDPR
ncbi:MAG: PQQ-binding-like beta-propeller repeat protein [Planctomycetes bacterium]|nr:PQQ-binding-like beta-propeller repeat protein [Planctomycetota bacterium]